MGMFTLKEFVDEELDLLCRFSVGIAAAGSR